MPPIGMLLIVAFVIFLVVKGFNHLRKKEAAKPAAPPAPTADQQLLTEIRDILKAKRRFGDEPT